MRTTLGYMLFPNVERHHSTRAKQRWYVARSHQIGRSSQVTNPYCRLLLTAFGQELARGSAWVAVDKRFASRCGITAGVVIPPGPGAVV